MVIASTVVAVFLATVASFFVAASNNDTVDQTVGALAVVAAIAILIRANRNKR